MWSVLLITRSTVFLVVYCFNFPGKELQSYLTEMNRCPSDMIRMCVISYAEKKKCEDMIMAFKGMSEN